MKLLYLDESGDHSLDVIDDSYPVFVLGGIIVDAAYAEQELTEQVTQFKRALFGREDLILRTADIRRNRNGFERLKDHTFREVFYASLNALMSDLEYKVVACAILKNDHLNRYGVSALDPYLLSLHVLVERFFFDIGRDTEGGAIIAERRDPVLDKQLELAWSSLLVSGTRYVQGVQIRRRIHGLSLRSKKENDPGLQLADLITSPVGRFVLGKKMHEDWNVISGKLRRHRGNWSGPGLVVLPGEKGPGPATQFPAH